tara:strand:+ start:199 stop:546 length:348 start_codon:yes stop_codon:yes gene_type:complete
MNRLKLFKEDANYEITDKGEKFLETRFHMDLPGPQGVMIWALVAIRAGNLSTSSIVNLAMKDEGILEGATVAQNIKGLDTLVQQGLIVEVSSTSLADYYEELSEADRFNFGYSGK